MNYEEAISFLKDTEQYGSRLGLDSIRHLMRVLGDIQEKIPIVHIAGTNGKGSVGAMLSSVLTESGYRVGRFNTPDVFFYEEEFLMNGVPVERERLAQLFTEVSCACEQMTREGLPHPTRFEVESAAAFLWFYQEECDIALVEVGMGGETDATNLITKPLVSVLTSISMDHMKFLGETISEITAAKAGIIKPGCPVVSVPQKPEAWEIIREKCRLEHAALFPADENPAENVSPSGRISFLWDTSVFDDGMNGMTDAAEITLGLRGHFQLENAVCALHVLALLKPEYPQINSFTVVSGLGNTCWPGRFEQIGSSPDIYIDGAHNEDAALKLRVSLDEYFPNRRIIYIMGVLADKEYEKMIRIMFHEGDRVYTLTPPNPRALSADDLAMRLKRQKIDAISCANPRDAVSYALADAEETDVILAFGSLSYLSSVREMFRDMKPERCSGGVPGYQTGILT